MLIHKHSLISRTKFMYNSFYLFFPVAYQVNGATMHFSHLGYFVVSVDACSGTIIQKNSFAKMDTRMEQYLKAGIPDR